MALEHIRPNPRFNTEPEAEVDKSNYIDQTEVMERQLGLQRYDYLDKHGKLQVAIHDAASRAVEKFKLAKHDIKEAIKSPMAAERERLAANAFVASQRAKARLAKAKSPLLIEQAEREVKATEKRHADSDRRVDEFDAHAINDRMDIKSESREKRENYYNRHKKRYHNLLTDRHLEDEGYSIKERDAIFNNISKEQAADIGVNALIANRTESRLAEIEDQLEIEHDPDLIDGLTESRDALIDITTRSEEELARAIEGALHHKEPEESKFDHENAKAKRLKEAVKKSVKTEVLDPVPANQSDQPKAPEKPQPVKPTPKPAKPAPEAKPPTDIDPEVYEQAELEWIEREVKLDEQRENKKRTEMINKLEAIFGIHAKSVDSSEADMVRVDDMIAKAYGPDAGFYILDKEPFSTWVRKHPNNWANLTDTQKAAYEDAWPALVDWYKD